MDLENGQPVAMNLSRSDDALCALAEMSPRKAHRSRCTLFGGLEVKVAEAIGISPETVIRDWKVARAWLLVELER